MYLEFVLAGVGQFRRFSRRLWMSSFGLKSVDLSGVLDEQLLGWVLGVLCQVQMPEARQICNVFYISNDEALGLEVERVYCNDIRWWYIAN